MLMGSAKSTVSLLRATGGSPYAKHQASSGQCQFPVISLSPNLDMGRSTLCKIWTPAACSRAAYCPAGKTSWWPLRPIPRYRPALPREAVKLACRRFSDGSDLIGLLRMKPQTRPLVMLQPGWPDCDKRTTTDMVRSSVIWHP
jgi:hypothetical protein